MKGLGLVNHLIQFYINFFENIQVLALNKLAIDQRTIPNKNCSRMACDLKTAYQQTLTIVFKTFEAVSWLRSFKKKIEILNQTGGF